MFGASCYRDGGFGFLDWLLHNVDSISILVYGPAIVCPSVPSPNCFHFYYLDFYWAVDLVSWHFLDSEQGLQGMASIIRILLHK